MALSTYDDLQTAILQWAQRVGDTVLAANLPDVIRLAETRIGRSIRVRANEYEIEMNCVPSSRYVPLPIDFNAPIALWMKAWLPRYELFQREPETIDVTPYPTIPEWWTIDNTNIAFNCPADGAYPFDFRYEGGTLLSDTNPSNYTLTNYPDLYLWGSLVELCALTTEYAQVPMWEQKYQMALQDSLNKENENRKGAPLVTELAYINNNRFNIYRGW